MAKRGRPVTYQTEDERPVTVSLRIPHDLYDQVERYVRLRPGMTLTEFFLDGARLRLDTPTDPRDLLLSNDNTVIRELQEMVNAAVERALAKERPTPPALATPTRSPTPEVSAQPVVTLSNYSNSVLQEPQQSTLPSADSPVAPEADSEPSVDLHNYNNTVIQQNSSAKRSGRPATMRESILNLLCEHSEGLTTEQIRGLLNAQKPIGDTLQGMRRANLVRTEGTGREMRYFLTS